MDLVIIPVNYAEENAIGNHWSVIAISKMENTMRYFDVEEETNQEHTANLFQRQDWTW